MFVIFGWSNNNSRYCGPVDSRKCQQCGKTEHWHLNQVSNHFSLFFIPVFFYSNRYIIKCPVCEFQMNLSDKEAKIYKSIAELNNDFLNDLITEDQRDSYLVGLNEKIELYQEDVIKKEIENSKNWISKVENKSNEELLEIINNQAENFQASYIIAVQNELKKRNFKNNWSNQTDEISD